MEEIDEITANFHAMTPWARRKLCEASRDYVRNWPDESRKSSLRLIHKAAPLELAPRGLDRVVNQQPPILVRKSVDN